jgi:hypothetical protein
MASPGGKRGLINEVIMHEFDARYRHWILKFRWLILLATLVLMVLAASEARHLHLTTNYRVFFSQENPQLLAFDALENTYTKNDNVMFVLMPKDALSSRKRRWPRWKRKQKRPGNCRTPTSRRLLWSAVNCW